MKLGSMGVISLIFVVLYSSGRVWSADSDVLLNEIHYNADPDNAGGEFLEIANHGATAVDISNWAVDEAVSFVFPDGTILAAGEYVVLANNAETAAAFYGVEIFGEYTGRFSNGGETLLLKNELLEVTDLVTFDDKSPWPTEADGGGPSLELRDPAQDNNDVASWGVGQPYSPGVPNVPTDGGAVGDVVINEIMFKPRREERRQKFDRVTKGFYTEQGDDFGGEYIEIVNVTGATIDLTGWSLSDGVQYDFGSVSIAPGGYLVIAGDPDALADRGIDSVGPFTGTLNDGGERVTLRNQNSDLVDTVSYDDRDSWPIAADQLGASLEVIDASFDNGTAANWRASETAFPVDQGPSPQRATVTGWGTPGEANSVAAAGVPPFVENVLHTPEQPTSSQDVHVTARVTGLEALTSVQIEYFEDNETSGTVVDMFDDGLHDDGDAGDGVYGADIPAHPSPTFVRYRVRAEDAAGRSSVFPYDGEPSEELAYFHFNNNIASAAPLYFLYIRNEDLSFLTRSPYSGRYVKAHLAIDGKAYPNIDVRLRGRGSRTNVKRQWKFRFNRNALHNGHRTLDTMVNLPYTQWFAFQMYDRAGILNLEHDIIRVYKNGSFFGVYIVFESPNSSWLRRHGHDQSSEVYKSRTGESTPNKNSTLYTEKLVSDWDYWGSFNKKIRALERPTDLRELVFTLNRTTSNDEFLSWVDQNVNYDEWMARWIVTTLMVIDDYPAHNWYIFRPGDAGGKWTQLGYDFCSLGRGPTLPALYGDGSFGDPNQKCKFFHRVKTNRTLARIYGLKVREILAEVWDQAEIFAFLDQNFARYAGERNIDGRKWGRYWHSNMGGIKADLLAQRRAFVSWVAGRRLPSSSKNPVIDPPGAVSDPAVSVTLSAPEGWIAVYTTDGSDPRLSLTRQIYDGSFFVVESGTVRAASFEFDGVGEPRFSGGEWTDLSEAEFEIGSGTLCLCGAEVAVAFSDQRVSAGSSAFSSTLGVGDFDPADPCGSEENCTAAGTLEVFGSPESTVSRHLYVNIVSQLPEGNAQIAGWAISGRFEAVDPGATLTGATTDGTAGCPVGTCPGVGLVDGGFSQTDVIDPARNDGRQGFVSSVVMTFNQEIVTLPSGQSTVVDLTFEVPIPAVETELPAASVYLEDGLRGAGQPVLNAVTIGDLDVRFANGGVARVDIVGVPGEFPAFLRGDTNGRNGLEPLADAVFLLRWLFQGGDTPPCLAACDFSGDGQLQINDPVGLLIWAFRGSDDPPEPFPECGITGLGTDEALGCIRPPECQ